jgi:beta-glucosidase
VNGMKRIRQSGWGAVVLGIVMSVVSPNVRGQIKTARPVYLEAGQPVEARIEDLLKRLTLEEKISLVHGDSKFTTAAIPRLGVPRRWMSDGPHGVREDVGPDTWKPAGRTDDFATYMPVLIALASTFNPDMANLYGQTIGAEARKRGKDILLGPGVNIARTPLNGRNYEYLGEDPYLAGQMAVGYIHGVQSQDVAACVKHFALNDQEEKRGSIDVEVDERALREIHLPAFQAAVQQGGALCVMGAYNCFRGEHCCQSDYLINTILKGEWGFKGLFMSDWGGAHETAGSVLHGLDLEMGTEKPYDEFFLAGAFRGGITDGKYPVALLDEKVRRNLRVMFASHVFDPPRLPGAINTKEHQQAALRVAEESVVLLKNDNALLPLDVRNIKTIAVIGDNAARKHAYGGDSARLKTLYEIPPLEGLVRRAGADVNIVYSVGYGETGLRADMLGRAVAAASQADVAIIFAGLTRTHGGDSEGADRVDLHLPWHQDELIAKVAAANKRTIVVLVSGSPVEMPWIEQVPGIVQAWYAGMESGNAIARVLFGDVNPSGKLACTFPKKLADSPAHALKAYPGDGKTVRYAEGLLVGYRWFDTKQIEPLFCFGHGLSYTTFDYSDLRIEASAVSFAISNSGQRAGAEAAQIYIRPIAPKLERPEKELKAFKKILLKPGERQRITVPLDPRMFSYYDPDRKAWVADQGQYEIIIGSSSRDIRLRGMYTLNHGMVGK